VANLLTVRTEPYILINYGGFMINLTQDLKPISYVKAHMTEVVNYVENSRAPIVITQNGES
jgi:hypothetical protein